MLDLRKVPQVMVKNNRVETTALFPFPIFLFVLWFYPFSFVFFLFFFLFLFFYVTEGEKQGSGVDSVCGMIKREMVAAR
jgi:H+/Cl- antiporter ClcA